MSSGGHVKSDPFLTTPLLMAHLKTALSGPPMAAGTSILGFRARNFICSCCSLAGFGAKFGGTCTDVCMDLACPGPGGCRWSTSMWFCTNPNNERQFRHERAAHWSDLGEPWSTLSCLMWGIHRLRSWGGLVSARLSPCTLMGSRALSEEGSSRQGRS